MDRSARPRTVTRKAASKIVFVNYSALLMQRLGLSAQWRTGVRFDIFHFEAMNFSMSKIARTRGAGNRRQCQLAAARGPMA
jgi:hypothetical protein